MSKTPQDGKSFDLRGGTTDPEAVSGYYDAWAATYDADTMKAWNYRAPSDAADRLAPHLSQGDLRLLDILVQTELVTYHRLVQLMHG